MTMMQRWNAALQRCGRAAWPYVRPALKLGVLLFVVWASLYLGSPYVPALRDALAPGGEAMLPYLPYLLVAAAIAVGAVVCMALTTLAILIGTHIGFSLSNYSDPYKRLGWPMADLARLFRSQDQNAEQAAPDASRTANVGDRTPNQSRFGQAKPEKDRVKL